MKIPIYCMKCDKHLKNPEEVSWVSFSEKFPTAIDKDDAENVRIIPLCKTCSKEILEACLPNEVKGE